MIYTSRPIARYNNENILHTFSYLLCLTPCSSPVSIRTASCNTACPHGFFVNPVPVFTPTQFSLLVATTDRQTDTVRQQRATNRSATATYISFALQAVNPRSLQAKRTRRYQISVLTWCSLHARKSRALTHGSQCFPWLQAVCLRNTRLHTAAPSVYTSNGFLFWEEMRKNRRNIKCPDVSYIGLTFRHHASYIWDNRIATPQSTLLYIQSTNTFNYFFRLSVAIFC